VKLEYVVPELNKVLKIFPLKLSTMLNALPLIERKKDMLLPAERRIKTSLVETSKLKENVEIVH
jgi:hypothetical protein